MKLLLTLPYHAKDSALLKRNLEWMGKLQPTYYPNSCLLVADFGVPHEEKVAMQQLAKPLFVYTETIVVRVPEEKQKWPTGANLMFAAAARQVVEAYRIPWLWFEPDAVPLVPGWLDTIAESYGDCPKRFMGSLVPASGQEDMPPVHLAGCAVYPPDAFHMMEQFTQGDKAFDIAAAGYTRPRAINFPPMQHFWGNRDLAPVFKETKSAEDPENVVPLSFIRPDAVMFHRCKDGSLIDLLSRKVNCLPETDTAPAAKGSPRKTVREPIKT